LPGIDDPAYAAAPTVTVVFYNAISSTAIKAWAEKRVPGVNRPNTSHIYWPDAT